MSLADLGAMLNVAIALIFLYLAVSLACSSALEAIAGRFDRRARMLKERIGEMLTPGKADVLYATSIIQGLSGANARPNYIPAIEFASGVIEMATAAGTFDRSKLPVPLAALYDEVNGNLDAFKSRIGLWYDNAMARLTGKYERWSQLWLFLLGVLLAALFNLDSLTIGSALWADRARLEPLVRQIEDLQRETGKPIPTDEAGWKALTDKREFRAALAELSEQLPTGATIPIGYEGKNLSEMARNAWSCMSPLRVIGWLITGLAAMLGAKFWFNALGQALRLRAAGVKPDTAQSVT